VEQENPQTAITDYFGGGKTDHL